MLRIERADRGGAADSGFLHFAVADTGIGIPADKVDKLFANFTQVDSSTTRKYGGTGLGLAIAKRIVELMGGRIWVQSEGGRGSTFRFTALFGVRAETPISAEAPLNLAGVRVLVVDDTPVNRLIVRQILARSGAQITEAEGGPEALKELQLAHDTGLPFRLVLLDCRMPGMDGIEVARLARESLGGSCPLLLMLTSDDLAVTRSRMREQGLDACLIKPIRKGELLDLIASAMNGGTNPESGRHAPAEPSVAVNAIAQRKLRILLADDSPDNRMLIKTYLKSMPWQIDMAEDGEQELAKFIGDEYSVVLMDIQMPVMDGHTATRRIREWEHEHGRTPTPVIALTAAALKEDTLKSLEAGCDIHVTKPVKKARLLEAIREAVERRQIPVQTGEDVAGASPAPAGPTPVVP